VYLPIVMTTRRNGVGLSVVARRPADAERSFAIGTPRRVHAVRGTVPSAHSRTGGAIQRSSGRSGFPQSDCRVCWMRSLKYRMVRNWIGVQLMEESAKIVFRSGGVLLCPGRTGADGF
jgi:hypothetical protein